MYVLVCHLYITHIYSYVACMSFICHSCVLVYYLYVLVCHSYVTRMYLHDIYMSFLLVSNVISLAYTRISSVFHSYVICISVVCARILSASHVTPMYFMSSVCPSHVLYVMLCHSYVLVYHPYVTRFCGFTMNLFFPLFL